MFKLNIDRFVGMSSSFNSVPVNGSLTSSNSTLNIDFHNGVIDDFIQQGKLTNQLYREIYLYDSVCGPTVDLLSAMPFSEFSLTGISDPKVLQVYEESLHELQVQQLMQTITTSYHVLGKAIGSLIFDETRGVFSDFILHNPDLCEISPIPLSGYDPKIDLKISPQMQKFLKSSDPRDREAQKEVNIKLRQQIQKGGKIPLEPLSTLYITRQTIPGIESISYFSRVLPMWLIEKALIRGTIIGAWRRQRSILHLQIGDEDWEPSPDQLSEIAQLFINADQDPIGAVVATRRGIEASELRSGQDFWRISDDWDVFANAKMRALGVGEAFLSGEASYNSMEVTLSVFIESLKAYREYITRKTFYEKIFLLLAKFHKFKKRTHSELAHSIRTSGYQRITALKETLQAGEYLIPEICWYKNLQPIGDQAYLDLLRNAESSGIPIPLKLIASASGLAIDKILEMMKEDLEFRKQISIYKEEMKKFNIIPEEGDENSGEVWSKLVSNIDPKIKEIGDQIPDEIILTKQQYIEYLKNNKSNMLMK